MRQRWTEEHVRDALAAADRRACRELVAEVVMTAVVDVREAHGRQLEDAIRYLADPAGEFQAWHADALDMNAGAFLARARQVLEERFGAPKARELWAAQELPNSVSRGTNERAESAQRG